MNGGASAGPESGTHLAGVPVGAALQFVLVNYPRSGHAVHEPLLGVFGDDVHRPALAQQVGNFPQPEEHRPLAQQRAFGVAEEPGIPRLAGLR